MATITPYETKAGKRWRVRYRKPDRSQTDKRGFKTRRDAALFAAAVEVSKTEGTYVDPTAGSITVRELGETWLATLTHLKPSSLASVETSWRIHVNPAWGTTAVAHVNHASITAWIADLTSRRSATIVLRAHGTLRQILQTAVDERRIPSNPAAKIKNLPRKKKSEHIYLTHQEVEALAAHSGRWETLIYVAAYTGLRFGELAGLRVKDVDMRRKRLRVEQNAVWVNREVKFGTPKTWERRSVPFPQFLTSRLDEACRSKLPDALVFEAPGGGVMKHPKIKTHWFGAAKRKAGIDEQLTFHGLRHTAASLAIQSGAHVKAVQRMLGHASAAMTLDTYSALFDTDLDDVAVALDVARSKAV